MKQIILMIIILILGTHIMSLADGGPSYPLPLIIFQESFNEKFPPDGWTLERTNQNRTWESVGSAFEDHLKPEDGYWFTYVQGDSLMPSDELLITPQIYIPYDCDNSIGPYNLDFYYYSTSTFSIEFSQGAYPEWDIIDKIDNGPSYPEYKWWNFREIEQTSLPSPFWIGFRFQDDQLSNNDAIALDYISFWCWEWVPEDDDDLDIDDDISYPDDDNSDDDHSDDDTGVLKASQGNNSNNHGCGCSMNSVNTDFSLFLALFLVGIGAWIVGKRRE